MFPSHERKGALLGALLFLLFATLPLDAQLLRSVRDPDVYQYYKTTSLSGAAETITIQQPATGARTVSLVSATVCSTADVTWTLSKDGTAATTTAGTPIRSQGDNTAQADVFHTSNVGSPTTLMAYPLQADECRTITLDGNEMKGNGTGKNYSLGSDSITATVYINIKWEER